MTSTGASDPPRPDGLSATVRYVGAMPAGSSPANTHVNVRPVLGRDADGTCVAAWVTVQPTAFPSFRLPPPTMTTPAADDLDPELTAAESELIDKLEEACELEPSAPGAEDTGELMRLEDALRAATQAAERAVELRRLRRTRESADFTCGVREFEDRRGRQWRLWAVAPSNREGRDKPLEQLRPEYQEGWLTFETIDESERRRLPTYPADWATLDVGGLEDLLARATPVPRRKRSTPREERPRDEMEPGEGTP